MPVHLKSWIQEAVVDQVLHDFLHVRVVEEAQLQEVLLLEEVGEEQYLCC